MSSLAEGRARVTTVYLSRGGRWKAQPPTIGRDCGGGANRRLIAQCPPPPNSIQKYSLSAHNRYPTLIDSTNVYCTTTMLAIILGAGNRAANKRKKFTGFMEIIFK